ncbi:hypothetical protein B0A49_03403 [Cryomyces minteri]|uniref:Uncharacterized protein n=1 Tax=Cryomyces minteri TaxID=331657 RepID=A0A4U0XSN3_9PEZI|nr:hypothetical protein B0A49_03403 [Cryomyces minteri]
MFPLFIPLSHVLLAYTGIENPVATPELILKTTIQTLIHTRLRYSPKFQWTCGDSSFTKYSPCSFDRAARDPHDLLNPLHPLVRPALLTKAASNQTAPTANPPTSASRTTANYTTQVDTDTPTNSPADLTMPSTLPLLAIGAASDRSRPAGTTGEESKCYVFEVVLQRREVGDCPACARSPRRRALPARARGCFGES